MSIRKSIPRDEGWNLGRGTWTHPCISLPDDILIQLPNKIDHLLRPTRANTLLSDEKVVPRILGRNIIRVQDGELADACDG